MCPSMTISADAGTSRSTVSQRTSSAGSPRYAPITSHSHTPTGIGEPARKGMIGSQPITHATGIGSPRAVYFRKCSPVLAALDQEERRRVRLADHATVDPDVHDARVGIARDDRGEGVDVPAPLEVVPLRNGELRLVDVPPAHDDLLDGAGRHAPRRDRLAVFLHHVLHERRVRRVLPEAEGLREPGPAAEPAREELRAAPRRVALDVLEEERGALFLEDAAGDGSELTVPVHLGRDPPQLALLLEPRDPPAQVCERHQATRVRRAPRVFAGSRVPGVGPRNVAAYGEAPRATSHSASGPAGPAAPRSRACVIRPRSARRPHRAPVARGPVPAGAGRRRTSARPVARPARRP